MAILTDDEIQRARAMRLEGLTFPQIKIALDTFASTGTIRAVCADIRVAGSNRKEPTGRAPVKTGRDRTIVSFTEAEDATLIEWNAAPAEARVKRLYKNVDPGGLAVSINVIARRMGRQRNALVSRLKSLKRSGRISTISL